MTADWIYAAFPIAIAVISLVTGRRRISPAKARIAIPVAVVGLAAGILAALTLR